MQKLLLLFLMSSCFIGSNGEQCGEVDYEAAKYDSVKWHWTATGFVGSPMLVTFASYTVSQGNPETHDVVVMPWNMTNSSSVTSHYINPNAKLDVYIQVFTLKNRSYTEQTEREMTPTPISVNRIGNETDGYELFAVKWPVVNFFGGRETNKMVASVFETVDEGNTGCSSSQLLQNDTIIVYEFYMVVWSKILPTTTSAEVKTSTMFSTSVRGAPVTTVPASMESTTSSGQTAAISVYGSWLMFTLTLFLFN